MVTTSTIDMPNTNRLRARRHAFASVVALVSMAITLLVFWSFARSSTLPFVMPSNTPGISSLTEAVMETLFITSFVIALISYQRFVRYLPARTRVTRWLNIVHHWAARLVVAFVLSIGWFVLVFLLLAPLMNRLQADFNRVSWLIVGTTAVGVAGVISYLNGYIVSRMTTRFTIGLAALVFVLGITLSIAFSTNLAWWTRAISFLGVDEYGYLFSATLAITGLLLLALMVDKMGDLSVMRARGAFESPSFESIRLLIIGQCLGFAGIGVFPHTDETTLAHQTSALLALGVTIFLMLTIWSLIPIYARRFHRLSVAAFAVCLGALIAHFGLRVTPFSLMEFILIGAGAMWIVLFYRYTRLYIEANAPDLITGALDV